MSVWMFRKVLMLSRNDALLKCELNKMQSAAKLRCDETNTKFNNFLKIWICSQSAKLPSHYLIETVLAVAALCLLDGIDELILMEVDDFPAAGEVRPEANQFSTVQYGRCQ